MNYNPDLFIGATIHKFWRYNKKLFTYWTNHTVQWSVLTKRNYGLNKTFPEQKPTASKCG